MFSNKKNTNDIVMNNVRLIMILKSTGKTDSEIAKAIGVSLVEFMNVLETNIYIKEVYDNAMSKHMAELESKFIEVAYENLEKKKTDDAKWILERTNKKYQKREIVDVNVKTIDEIIKENT